VSCSSPYLLVWTKDSADTDTDTDVVCCSAAELHDAIFVIGSLDEMLMLRGMRYHPIDIENSIVRSHRNICEWSVTLSVHRLVSADIMLSFVGFLV